MVDEPPMVDSPRRRRRGARGGKKRHKARCAPEIRNDDNEDLCLRIQMEGMESAVGILRVACESLDRLTWKTTLAAIVLAAKKMPVDDRETAQGVDCLLGHLAPNLSKIRDYRTCWQLCWALGKFITIGEHAAPTLIHMCGAQTACWIPLEFTTQMLTNTLWALGRLASDETRRKLYKEEFDQVPRFAVMLVMECTKQVTSLSSQCLSNSLWAVARLHLRCGAAQLFLDAAVEDMCSGRDLCVFTPQALANILWALAELGTSGIFPNQKSRSGDVAVTPERVCAVFARASQERLAEFHPMEIAMLANAMVKLLGQGQSQDASISDCNDLFLAKLAKEAQRRLPDFSAQGVSNIAWALAKRGLLYQRKRCAAAMSFVEAAAQQAFGDLRGFTPQAVANLMWAVVRLRPAPPIVKQFAALVCRDATERISEFRWRDLSGVASALAYGHVRTREGELFAHDLVASATDQCGQLPTQVMLNIALSALRLHVDPVGVTRLVDKIAVHVQVRPLNRADLRQWTEIHKLAAMLT
uniref:Uncharacterized protein n=1 Tax=Noctiluca scintillans TaxID=2966 RepID=A0A7S1EYX6_NOCSC